MKNLIPAEYRAKAITSIVVIAVGVLIFILAQQLDSLFAFFRALVTALRPVLIGVGIAYLLSPPLRRTEAQLKKLLERKKSRPKLCRTIGVVVVYIAFLAMVTTFMMIVIPQVYNSITSVVRLIIRFINTNSDTLNSMLQKLGFLNVDGTDFVIAWEGVINQAMGHVATLFTNALEITQELYSLVLNTLVAIAVSIYSLFEKEHFGAQVKKMLYSLMPKDACASVIYWMRRSNLIFSGFISGKIIDSIIMGTLCYICMRLFKMPYPELISVIFGVTNVVPFFGPIVGGVIGSLLMLIVDPMTAVWFAVMVLVLQQLDGNLIGPYILGGSIGLSAFWIMLAILVGGGMFGFTGMLLGAPVFAIIYALLRALINFRLAKRGLTQDTDAYRDAPDSLEKQGDDK